MIFTNKNSIIREFTKLIPWIIIVLCIGTQPSDFDLLGTGKANTLNATRLILAMATSLIIIIVFVFNVLKLFFVKTKLSKIDNKYLIFYLFLIYFIFQACGYFLNLSELRNKGYADSYYLIILSFAFIAYFFLIKKTTTLKNIKYFLYFLYFTICVAGLFLTVIHISKSSLESANYFSLYNSVLSQHQFFLNHELPRVTGISRTLSIFSIILISLYFLNKNKFVILFITTSIFVLSIIIFAFQSRGTILCYTLSLLFFLFLFKKKSLKKKIAVICFSILLPYLSFEGIRHIQFESIKADNSFSIFSPFKKNELETVKIPFNKDSINTIILNKNRLLDMSSSGRIDLWKSSIRLYDKNLIFGYGPQGDRYLLRDNLKTHSANNVSNGYIYSFLSGGYFGFFIFIIIIINLLYFLFKSIFINKIFNSYNSTNKKLSLTIFVYFLLRINFENSFSVFGIDFILMFISILIFLIKEKKITL